MMTTVRLFGLTAFAALLTTATVQLRAESAPPAASDPLIQKEFKQQQIRANTQKLGDQLTELTGEFERNGIGGDDLQVLQAIKSVLWNLTDKEMEKVINLLQQARSGADVIASQKRVIEAYSGQKSIVVQLRQLLLEYRRQLALYELSVHLGELAGRQGANLHETVALAKVTQGKKASDFEQAQTTSLQMQQTEQQALAGEVKAVIAKLDSLAKESVSVTADLAKTTAQQAKAGQLLGALESAAEDLKSANLMSAAGSEKTARDQLRDLSRLLAPAKDEVTALRQAMLQIDQMLPKQKQLIEQTKNLSDHKADAGELENEQADLVDKTDMVRKDLNNIAPAAATELQNATDKMQEARNALADKQAAPALAKETAAVKNLQQARAAVQEQLAKAELQKQDKTDPLAKLKQLQKETRELVAQQSKLNNDPDAKKDLKGEAAKEDGLKAKAQDLQHQAAQPSPPAAKSLADAASQMNKAQQAMANEQPAPAAQQAALDALTKADQQLAQDINKLEQAQRELGADQAILQKLAQLIQAEQQIELATAKAIAAAKNPPPPLKELAAKQGQVSLDTDQLRLSLVVSTPAVATNLGDARQQMNTAQAKLDRLDALTARPAEQEALAELIKAREALEDKVKSLEAQLGQQPAPDPQAQANAAAQIEQAQQQVAQAMEQMQPAAQMQALQQQQQQIAQALQQMAQNPPAAQPPAAAPLAQAQQAAQQAAQQLANNNVPAAVQAMEQAQAAMQQAQPPAAPPEPGQPAQPEPGQPEAGQPGQPEAGAPHAGAPHAGAPSLSQLAQQQAQVQQAAQQMIAANQPAPQPGQLAQAAQELANAANAMAPFTNAENLGAAQQPVQQAQQAMAQAAANAAANQAPSAQANAAQAQQALAEAQAAMAMAQAGMTPSSHPGSHPGEHPGNHPGNEPGNHPGQPSPVGSGKGNFKGGAVSDGDRHEVAGDAAFIGLPARDRQAIQQSKAEAYPEEYGPMVEQYLKNLSDQSEGSK